MIGQGPGVFKIALLRHSDIGKNRHGVMRPILLLPLSENQRLPSGPAVMPFKLAGLVGTVNDVTVPCGVMRPIRLPLNSVNHKFPSGPAAIPSGEGVSVEGNGSGNSVTVAVVVMRPMLW